LAERPPFLAVINDDPDAALLCSLDADLDAVHEVRAARADIRAEHVRAVAFVVHAAGDYDPRLGDLFDGAEEIYRHAADPRQKDLDVRPCDELGEHTAGFFEQGAPQVGFGDSETAREPGQMPYRIDRRLRHADLAVVEQHPPIGPQRPVREQRAQLGGD